MIDRQRLLDHLKPLLRLMETDLRARCDEVAQINANLTKEYEQARAANRAGATFEEWRADLITQVAVAWVLSSVFVRFLEDNSLVFPPRISGPLHGAGDGQGLMRARDERDLFFRSHPTQTDRDYLLAVYDDLAKLPGTKDVFGPHNLVSAYRDWLSGDAAQKLIEFFQKIDADGTGEIVHDFCVKHEDTKTRKIEDRGQKHGQGEGEPTRFLGDLYQDLSEAARKKYALLQTPVFVEEFILERTLEPAIREFGLKDFKMIDPACGSGHFLLGSFARILAHWRKAEPGTNDRELVNRALAAVHGVDLNPYAVAIARFRLLLAAMKECQVTQLKDAPGFRFNLACGDSLLHGIVGGQQQVMGFHELAHHYQSEDIDELRRILKPGQYHAVVANPPYITVKDKAINQAYRERYPDVCHRQYSLAVPFLQRLFEQACHGGFTGQITANSFMKREFGKKLVESYLPKIDLTHVIDTSGAYIPGHGTPTVILFGRQRKPVAQTVRAVMGIKGEPATPADPAQGQVWTAILDQIDRTGSLSAFVSVSNTPRDQFGKHPWSIGGGGAAELKRIIDEAVRHVLIDRVDSIGRTVSTQGDDIFLIPKQTSCRYGLGGSATRRFVIGEEVRDWLINNSDDVVVFPYDEQGLPIRENLQLPLFRFLWSARTTLSSTLMFGAKTKVECGLKWYEYGQWLPHKLRTPLSIVFGFVATHNHFVVDRGGKVFNRSAPVIKLSASASEDDHLILLGLLNSSTACFWLKQVAHNKGSTVDEHGARQRTAPFEDFFEFTSTQLEGFPLTAQRSPQLAQRIDALARQLSALLPDAVLKRGSITAQELDEARAAAEDTLGRMIALQEELDWQCYQFYGLIDDAPLCANPPSIKLGGRAFEVVLAQRVAAGEEDTTWFVRHASTPITQIPAKWTKEYREIIQRRIDLIKSDRNIGLIERPEYKRRWNNEPWEDQQEKALRNWLLDRLESYFDLDGRMNDQKNVTARGDLHQPKLTSVAKVADLAKQDGDFMQVAELYTGRMDFDVANLVGDLIAAESVPCLPVLRYKPTGLDKRASWERTWELQRLEDAVDIMFEVERLKKIAPGKAVEALRPLVAALPIDEQVKPQVLADAVGAADYITEATKQKLNLTNKLILKPVTDAARCAKQRAIGDIPVPPKYTSADFLSSHVWRLRGKLDVPKERWVSFPHCEGEDGTLVIAWAGYDQLQLARAIAERYEQAKEHEGHKLVPLLAAIGQLIPWLKQWHNELDPVFGTRMGDYFEDYLAEEAKALGMSVDEVMAWKPPEKTKKSNTKTRRREG
jgi:hypothetical protein